MWPFSSCSAPHINPPHPHFLPQQARKLENHQKELLQLVHYMSYLSLFLSMNNHITCWMCFRVKIEKQILATIIIMNFNICTLALRHCWNFWNSRHSAVWEMPAHDRNVTRRQGESLYHNCQVWLSCLDFENLGDRWGKLLHWTGGKCVASQMMQSSVGHGGWRWLGMGCFPTLSIVIHPFFQALCVNTQIWN